MLHVAMANKGSAGAVSSKSHMRQDPVVAHTGSSSLEQRTHPSTTSHVTANWCSCSCRNVTDNRNSVVGRSQGRQCRHEPLQLLSERADGAVNQARLAVCCSQP